MVALDQRAFGAEIAPRVLVTAVDAVLVGAAALVTFSLTEDRLARRGFEPTGDPGDVTRWLAKALGTPSLAIAFPDGHGSALDLSGRPVATPLRATSVQDADGQRVRLAEPTDAGRRAAGAVRSSACSTVWEQWLACAVGSGTRPTR